MAEIKVKYTVIIEEVIDWPDDELENLTYDNLLLNCEVDNARSVDYDDIIEIKKDDKYFQFN